jgi:SAM-dependent methyltransferase
MNSPSTISTEGIRHTQSSTASVCKSCGASLRLRLATVRDPQTQETFAIQECTKCGLGHTQPQPANLNNYYRDYHGGRHGKTAAYCARRRVRLLKRARGNRAGYLLDFGCGDGTFLLAARSAGWTVAGTEMNPRPARDAGLEVFSDLTQAASHGPFDAITLWHTFEHMTDPRRTLRDLRALLAPDGVLVIAVPDAGGLQAGVFGPSWFHLDVPRHLYHFTRKSLLNMLDAEGFAPSHEWHQEFEYDLLGWSQSALNVMGLRQNLFFDLLRGYRTNVNPWSSALSLLAGAVLTGISLPLVPLGTLAKRGGTLIVAAHLQPSSTR